MRPSGPPAEGVATTNGRNEASGQLSVSAPDVDLIAATSEAPISDDVTPDEVPQRISEAADTLRAIRAGEVDAFVVSRGDTHEVFSLATADVAYRMFVENMRDDSQVVAAIKRFKSGEQPAAPAAPATPTPAPAATARPSASR